MYYSTSYMYCLYPKYMAIWTHYLYLALKDNTMVVGAAAMIVAMGVVSVGGSQAEGSPHRTNILFIVVDSE
jgi:hypothetical protein